MRLTTFLVSCGFRGVTPRGVKNLPPADVKAASFIHVDFERIRATFGKTRHFNPNKERFFFHIDREKALVIDTVNKRVLLSNSRVVYQRLLKYTNG